MLEKAENEVKSQISELSKKKSEQMDKVAQNICENNQIQKIDQKISNLQNRKLEKQQDLQKVQCELDELEKNTEKSISETKNKVFFHNFKVKFRLKNPKLNLKNYAKNYQKKQN